MTQAVTPFDDQKIRRIEQNGVWYFSIVDIIEVLTDSTSPRTYWAKLKAKLAEESGFETFPNLERFKLLASDGKMRLTDCANTEGVLRLIQSIPSPKAEPFKMWLADLGTQAIEEFNNPEILTERQAELYRAKGMPEDWIKERLQSIATRRELTDEWQKRGVKEGQEYSILTATVAKGVFGLTPTEHSKLKGLNKENLRDHMTRMELIFTSLSEEVTRTIAIADDAQGFNENHDAAVKGGEISKKARLNIEKGTGVKVVSAANYLNLDAAKNETKKELLDADENESDRVG